jgi:hypothetical protein
MALISLSLLDVAYTIKDPHKGTLGLNPKSQAMAVISSWAHFLEVSM